jgi:hypothetical protein
MSKKQQIAVVGDHSLLYARMSTAIAECYSVDDCAEMVAKASGIAAYCEQAKDDDGFWKFLAIKLRAWRRIGELMGVVDILSCATRAEGVARIKAHFKDEPAVQAMTDIDIKRALALALLPVDFFEQEIGRHTSVTSIIRAYEKFMHAEWKASPAGQEAQARAAEQEQQRAVWEAEEAAKRHAAIDQAAREAAQRSVADTILRAMRDEVGVTMDPRDRLDVKRVPLTLNPELHAVLLKASQDHHPMTMLAILREGMITWLAAHGYDIPGVTPMSADLRDGLITWLAVNGYTASAGATAPMHPAAKYVS